MYPQQGQVQAANSLTQVGYASEQVPQSSGVASRVLELQKSVSSLQNLVYQTKSALGLSSPPTEAKNPREPGTLAEVITDLRCRVDSGCLDLEGVIQHLNS